ncbi:MAG TPA: hypothetical protein VFP25_06670, partial [Nitrososphaeraceae archaeon]|nr:hypothetical protein [Nitrososphaeraceae archaeon]
MSIRVYSMKSHNAIFSFLLVITISIVYGSLLNNFPNVYSQVFEIDENDYFEFDDTTSNTNNPSEEFAKKESSDGDDDENQDKKGNDNKKSKKKSKKIDEDDPASYSTSQYSGKYNIEDVQQHYVQKYYLNGTFISSWGSKGTGDGQFLHPHNLAVDSKGNVYVTDEQRSDVQKFDSEGNFLLSWGEPKDKNLFSHKMEDV